MVGRNLSIFLVLVPLFAVSSGCTLGPDYHPPMMPIPGRWTEPTPKPDERNRESANLAEWWRGFHDRRLDALIDRTLLGNLDLQAAEARVSAARAQRLAAAAEQLPGLGAFGGYQRQRISPNAVKGLLGEALSGADRDQPGGAMSSLGPIGAPFNLFQAGFDSSWELDLFGGIARKVEAADAITAAAEESRRGIAVTLTAEVARNYLELLALHRNLEIAHLRLDNQRKLYSLVDQSFHEGLADPLDVERTKAQLGTIEATVPAIEARIKLIRHGLAWLLGLQPASLERELARLDGSIPSPPSIPPGLTADLLRRRPDIRLAERSVAAATALVGSAVAELFPKVSLTGVVGLQSQELSNLGSFSSGFYGFGPRVSLPLFQGGRLKANIDAQEAKSAEAIKNYERTVLNAFREVEDAMAFLNGEERRRQSLISAESSARVAAENALALYAEGEVDLLAVLEANRAWYDVQDQLTESELAWSAGHIALFKSLGGGWKLKSDHPVASLG